MYSNKQAATPSSDVGWMDLQKPEISVVWREGWPLLQVCPTDYLPGAARTAIVQVRREQGRTVRAVRQCQPVHTANTLRTLSQHCTVLYCGTALALPQATPPNNPLFIVLFSPRTIQRPKLSNSRRRCRQPALPVLRTRHTDLSRNQQQCSSKSVDWCWLKVSLHL